MTISPTQRKSPSITLIYAPLFLALLPLLHILEPEIDPSWRMISEYELGA